MVGRLAPATDAAERLREWGWQKSAFQIFACDAPPAGAAGWVQVSVHRFGDPFTAKAAADRFAAGRASGSALDFVAPPTLADDAVALVGPVANGTEVSVYAASGPLVVRVTAVAATGEPAADAEAVLRQVLAAIA